MGSGASQKEDSGRDEMHETSVENREWPQKNETYQWHYQLIDKPVISTEGLLLSEYVKFTQILNNIWFVFILKCRGSKYLYGL